MTSASEFTLKCVLIGLAGASGSGKTLVAQRLPKNMRSNKEMFSEETESEVILVKDKNGRLIGFKKLNFILE